MAATETKEKREVTARFTLMKSQETGVSFVNQMREDYNYNNFVFEYMYNGGGVAAGDVNGDGLPDLYFSSSRFSNKLFINKGNFKFADVTETAGVGAKEGFKTGVAMADVNGDGRLDIYCCRTSKTDDGLKTNHLFINMGVKLENGVNVPIFEDQAKQYGLDDNSNSNHACFFDYDRDGDMDLFLVNHKLGFTEANKLRIKQQPDGSTVRYSLPDTPFESDRMYRNDNGKFTDVTAKAGMISSTYGLSATASDLNGDGWLDLYVANDYVEPDFIYINNKDGTFTDHFATYLRHGSHSSMGVDITDMNNDNLPDIMVLEMKAEDPVRYKELMNIMLYDRYNMMVEHGYGRQVGRNVLQVNNGNGSFSEIGQFAGIAATDWSWGILMADYDNDGWKDMYISNGYRKDVSQLDYLNYFRDSLARAGGLTSAKYPDINDFLKYLPEKKIRGYCYINNRDLTFYDATAQVGMNQASFSNGAAYADLDQDGDLDIIVNNIDDPAFIYRNDIQGENWLQIDLTGSDKNTDAIGAVAEIKAGGQTQWQMLMLNKGFFSTSEPILHFGLGKINQIDTIILTWPDGKMEIKTDVAVNQRLKWKTGDGKAYKKPARQSGNVLFARHELLPGWIHQEDDFVDIKRERLLPYMLSAEGPCLAVGDLNGDQLADLFAGSGKGFASALYTQSKDGTFTLNTPEAFTADAGYEDCGAVMEDFDGDGDLDVVVISGGNSMPAGDATYYTRYYTNPGNGNLVRETSFPQVNVNAGAILSYDFDGDKDLDIVIGGRAMPGSFPTSPPGFVLQNDNGKFTDVSKALFPESATLGMVTAMEHGDLDGDGSDELIVVGEWMSPRIFSFDGKKFIEKSESFGFKNLHGWWKCVAVADIDKDGDLDIVAGNMGTNHRLKASTAQPLTMVVNDFDENGSLDPIMCYYNQGALYPYAQRDAIIGQIPRLKKKFTRYNPYARATLEDVFSKSELEASTYYYTHTFATTYFRNDRQTFVAVPLPPETQWSPVFDMILEDVNGDNRVDMIMAGNFTYAETETGEMDGGNGLVLLQNGDGSFTYVPNTSHGFWAQKEVRELVSVPLANGNHIIVTGNNRGPLEVTYPKFR